MEEKEIILTLFSNFDVAQKKTREYLGKNTELFISPRKIKNIESMILSIINGLTLDKCYMKISPSMKIMRDY